MTLKPKTAVDYRPVDTPGQSCHTCRFRIDNGDADSTCSKVQGTVDPQHVCDLFQPGQAQQGSRTMTDTSTEERAKYKAADLKDMAAKGKAMKNASGDPSYPIDDAEDLDNAIHAVGRGGADHDAIRAHIIKNAKRLGLMSKIPDNWNADGSLKQANAVDLDAEMRENELTEASFDQAEVEAEALLAEAQDVLTRLEAHEPRRKPRHRSTKLAPEFRVGREVRLYAAGDLEVRDANDGSNAVEIVGAPIVYNQPYSVRDMLGEFEETMKPGVAAGVLGRADCRFLINHDGLPLARTASGTLKLTDTPDALTFSAFLDTRSSQANDLIVAIQRGDVSQMSCGFVVAEDTWSDDWSERSIHRFDELLDVSAVTYPASPTTSIDIANRMMMEVPVESRARVQKLWSFAATELRAGQTLSSAHASHIKNAAASIQAVLNNATAAGDHLDKVTSTTEADGTQNAPVLGTPAAQDATGSRGAAVATELRLELDLIKARRRRA